MRKLHLTSLAALMCLATAPAFAQGAGGDHKFYIGLDVGRSEIDREAMLDEFVVFDDSSTTYAVRFGYRVNRYFALEAGYTDLGDYAAAVSPVCTAQFPSPCPADAVSTNTSIDGFLVNAVGVWPISEHFQLNASLGAIYREISVTSGQAASPAQNRSESDTVMKLGVGLGVPINDRFEIDLDVALYQDIGLALDWNVTSPPPESEGDSTVVSLGLRWNF